MSRPDANAIGLRALRLVLQAAHDYETVIAGQAVSVVCTLQPASNWPRVLAGLDEERDGPWPTAVDVVASWAGGHTELTLSGSYWRTKDHLRHLVGLGAKLTLSGRELLWVTVPHYVKDTDDGERARVAASVPISRLNHGEAKASKQAMNRQLRSHLRALEIPFVTPWKAELMQVQVPEGLPLPSAEQAFRRAVSIALVKHPYFVRGTGIGIVGTPLIDVQVPHPAEVEEPVGERRAGLWPLPGGTRAYHATLKDLVAAVAEGEPMPLADFHRVLAERYEVTGPSSRHGYRRMVQALGLIEEQDKELLATDLGREWLSDPSPEATFELLHHTFLGVLAPLVLSRMDPSLSRADVQRVIGQALGADWKTGNQVNFRSYWAMSLGLLERRREGDTLTASGRAALERYPDEVEELELALEVALQGTDEGRDDGGDELNGPSGDASAWESPVLDLRAEQVLPELDGLRLPNRVLEQCCAALSAGKHLLLVGPPGTGKTELAEALARAAASEGYCRGLFGSTASADWTTFDTIGGYALQANSSLAFRRGVFLQALHQQKWLLIDELNRADIDRAFGELMTVLSGKGTDTAFVEDGELVSIGPEERRRYVVPGSFRVVGTMNTWDKTSLFRLSYAVQRRFAMVTVGIPEDGTYAAILEHAANKPGVLAVLESGVLTRLQRLFCRSALLDLREVGPAVALDIVRYHRRRRHGATGLAEALELFLMPQLEGLDANAAQQARTLCLSALGDGVDLASRRSLDARFCELFPMLDPEA